MERTRLSSSGYILSISFDFALTHQNIYTDDETKDDQIFEECHREACNFIRKRYEQLNRNPYKKIFVHITTATNKENIESVFWDVQNIIVSGNMKTSGLV